FMEVNHGPFLIENNLFLSELSLRDWSQGGAYVHNLFAGNIEVRPQSRLTPFHLPHSTELAGLKETRCGDNRFFNNIFVGGAPEIQGRFSGLKEYANTQLPVTANGNIYLNEAQPFPGEKNFLQLETNPEIRVLEQDENVSFLFDFDSKINRLKTSTVTSELLGKAIVPNLPFENPDGTSVKIDSDYFGTKRNSGSPTPGPFEKLEKGENRIKVW
ncbi:MAG: hypothetical protein LC658_06710, partial [Bacteroidales bacterium]|nr:hypothetical protein [Bacteroidales bacterium]